MKVSIKKEKLTGLWVRNCATFQQVLISKFAFGPEKLSGLSRNGLLFQGFTDSHDLDWVTRLLCEKTGRIITRQEQNWWINARLLEQHTNYRSKLVMHGFFSGYPQFSICIFSICIFLSASAICRYLVRVLKTPLFTVIAGDKRSRNGNLQVVITHALHVCSQYSFGLPLRMSGIHITQFDHARLDLLSLVIWSSVFWPSVKVNFTKSRALEQNRFDLRSLSPALCNLWFNQSF